MSAAAAQSSAAESGSGECSDVVLVRSIGLLAGHEYLPCANRKGTTDAAVLG